MGQPTKNIHRVRSGRAGLRAGQRQTYTPGGSDRRSYLPASCEGVVYCSIAIRPPAGHRDHKASQKKKMPHMRTPQIVEYLLLLLINLFLIVGIWKLTEKDMLLGWLGDWLYRILGKFWSKPVYECPPCMASIWGVTFFFGAKLDQLMPWYFFPLHSLALCGLATLAMMLDNK